MARTGKGSTPSKGEDQQEEMTVIVVRVKGQGDTLRKGFDAISSAFASLGAAPPAPRRLGASTNGNLNGTVTEELPEDALEEEVDNEETVIEATSSSTARPRKYKFLDDFDLNAGPTPWKEFAASKAPKTDSDCYLVASLWITENAGLATFTVNHVFTCFRAMQWNEQKDFSQPMRLMKSKKSYFDNPSRRSWKLTQVGLEAARAIVAPANP
jgi:hypothetical protein